MEKEDYWNKGNKFLIFAIFWFIAMILLAIYLESKSKQTYPNINYVSAKNISEPYFITTINGTSMEQYGIKDNSTIKVYTKRKCKEGEICIFKCNAEKCKAKNNTYFIKKLIKKNKDCYWFEGNPKPIEKVVTRINDNGSISKSIVKIMSFDSRIYGFLCGKELIIKGESEQIKNAK
jgi:hypothetical protein